jgi:hypothetical protein
MIALISTSSLASKNISCQQRYEASVGVIEDMANGLSPVPKADLKRIQVQLKKAKSAASNKDYCKAYNALLNK